MLGAVTVSPETMIPIINEMSQKYGIEPAWIKAHIKAESNWDVNASRYEAGHNDASWGLMQVMLATAKDVLGDPNLTITTLTQPRVNIEAGTKYLSQLWSRFGNMRDTIAAYNAGSPRLNKTTGKYVNQDYVDKVTKNYNIYKALGSGVVSNIVANAAIDTSDVLTDPNSIPLYMLLGLGVVGIVIFSSDSKVE